MYNVNNLGKKIASYRRVLGITQEELACRLNITAQAVSKWENELSYPDITILPDLAKALNTSIEKLFGNESSSLNNLDCAGIGARKFPEYLNESKKLVHVFNNVACYSEKEVDIISDDTVSFKDGSSANLHSLKIINKGEGEICFDFKDEISIIGDYNQTEINKIFDGITSVIMDVVNADFELDRSKDKKTYVSASGSPLFLSKLRIIKEGEFLSIKFENMNNGSGNSNHKNKVIIKLGSDSGSNVSARVNGSGNCAIKIPFLTGNVSINGSGNVMFDHIATVECKINGSGDITCNKAGNLTIHINGSGDFKSNEVYGDLKSKINGSGDICPGSGQLGSFEVRINGSGDVDARNICTQIADIAVEGSGEVTIGRVVEQSTEKHSKNSSIKILKRGKLSPMN